MSFWPFAPVSFWTTFDSFFEKYQNNMLDVYWSRRLKICLLLRIPHYGICVKLAEAGFYCLLWDFLLLLPSSFFLFFFILGMTLSSQLSLYDKGINPFFQLDRVMWFEGCWGCCWQTWTEFWLNWKNEESIVILALWNVDYFRSWLLTLWLLAEPIVI